MDYLTRVHQACLASLGVLWYSFVLCPGLVLVLLLVSILACPMTIIHLEYVITLCCEWVFILRIRVSLLLINDTIIRIYLSWRFILLILNFKLSPYSQHYPQQTKRPGVIKFGEKVILYKSNNLEFLSQIKPFYLLTLSVYLAYT